MSFEAIKKYSTKHKQVKEKPKKTYFLQGAETKKLYIYADTREDLHKLVKQKFPSMERDGKRELDPVYPEPMRFVTGKLVSQ